MSWGIKAPEGAKASWGARAIFQDGRVEIVWDRQGGTGDEELISWLNAKGIKQLRKLAKDLASDEDREVRYQDGEFVVAANPRGSYGYLYLGAWRI